MTQYILNKAPSFSGQWHIWTGENTACGLLTLRNIKRNSITTESPYRLCKHCRTAAKRWYAKPVLNKRGDVLHGYSVAIKKRLADARKIWLWKNGKLLNYRGNNDTE